jgi:diaminopimelate decarboxylase
MENETSGVEILTVDAGQSFGGVTASELARTYGTPLIVIDTDVLDRNVAAFVAIGRECGVEVAYAGKALLFVALAQRIVRAGLSLDVCSLGELYTAERAGVQPDRLILHGCGKTDAELGAALAGRVGRIVVDNREELERLIDRADPARPVRALLRVNSGIEAHTHAYVRTGGDDSKFGFPLEALDDAFALCAAAPGIRLVGIHTHIGSQIFESDAYEAAAAVMLDVLLQARGHGIVLEELVLGGGYGVAATPDGETFDAAATVRGVARIVARSAAARGVAPPRLGIEPGRAIVAAAGTTLYRVVSIKHQGSRRYAIVDGGMTDNPRPALYDAYHHPELASRASTAELVETTISGRACENDELVRSGLPSDLRAGDILALATTGAYTFSMASNYNRFARPAVVFAGGGTHRLVVRRESLEDLVRNDLDADAG